MTDLDPLDPPPLAPPVKRLAGFVVDLLILTAFALVIVPLTGASTSDSESLGATSTFALANVFVLAFYQVGFIALKGQTPGKMLLSIKVVDATTFAIPSLTNAIARFALPVAAGFVPGLSILPVALVYAWLLWDRNRQGLHDKLAHTLVVEVA